MEKKKRGRPPGSKKPPKVDKKKGRPSAWAEQHGYVMSKVVCAPKRFFEHWQDMTFRTRISDLMIEIDTVEVIEKD